MSQCLVYKDSQHKSYLLLTVLKITVTEFLEKRYINGISKLKSGLD